MIIDKNHDIETVINKVDDVGSHDVFRTFPFEVLAGKDNMRVVASSCNCEYRFDFSKVYWNQRLDTEHKRVVDKFKEGEAVCDVMAGVGPFAVPAGKKHVFVHANDLNPFCYQSLTDAIQRNKVHRFVRAYNEDGRDFIKNVTWDIRQVETKAVPMPYAKPQQEKARKKGQARTEFPTMEHPQTFDHYVMNLPASAIGFLDAFDGIYARDEERFEPHTDRKLPMIHVYCFAPGFEVEPAEQNRQIRERISSVIGWKIEPDTPELEIWHVRSVSPKKEMFCVSFRLPPQVAFRVTKS